MKLVTLKMEKLKLVGKFQTHIFSNAESLQSPSDLGDFLSSVLMFGNEFKGEHHLGWISVRENEEGMILYSIKTPFGSSQLMGIRIKLNEHVRSVLSPRVVHLNEVRIGFEGDGESLVVVAEIDQKWYVSSCHL